MKRTISLLIFALIALPGCNLALIAKTLFKPQEWSDNYARMPGVECTEPGLIDGELLPVKVPRRVILSFPKRMSIHRVIIRGTNVEDMIIYASLGPNEWKEIARVKNNREETIDLRVRAVTDELMFVFGETREDKVLPGQASRDAPYIHPRLLLGVPRVAEIEVYGFKEVEPKAEELIF